MTLGLATLLPTVSPSTMPELLAHEAERYKAVKQYSLRQILGVWAAATVPMGVLAWIVAPWLADRLGGREPLVKALLTSSSPSPAGRTGRTSPANTTGGNESLTR
jgi:O-antigen/teichoic acid export membrane protein